MHRYSLIFVGVISQFRKNMTLIVRIIIVTVNNSDGIVQL